MSDNVQPVWADGKDESTTLDGQRSTQGGIVGKGGPIRGNQVWHAQQIFSKADRIPGGLEYWEGKP